MRFRDFGIARFGRFSDRRLEFPAVAGDFHLVVGPNEAGKSTLRAAIGAFLFGIGGQTPYNFLYDYEDLRLDATVERDGSVLELTRVKKRRSLLGADGAPVDDDALGAWLGAGDEAFYEQMFSLDHVQLRDGSARMLEAGGDLGRQLFEASAGAASVGDLRRSLDEECDTLWGPRASRARAWSQAETALKEAQEQLRSALTRVKAWEEARKARADAQADHEISVGRLEHLELERTRFERVRRVAPILQALDEQRRELASVADVPTLPSNAAQIVDEVNHDVAQARARIAAQETLIERAERQLDAVRPDAQVLVAAAEIAALDAEAKRLVRHAADLAKRESEAAIERSRLTDLAGRLGWRETDIARLRAKLPPELVRAEINALITAHGRLDTALARDRRQLQRAREASATAREALEQLPELCVSPRLAAALAECEARTRAIDTEPERAAAVQRLER